MNPLTIFFCLNFLLIFNISVTANSHPEEDADEEMDPADVEEPGCPQIDLLTPVTLDKIMGQWYLPYLSRHWISYTLNAIYGASLRRSLMEVECLSTSLNLMPKRNDDTNSRATILMQNRCPNSGAELNIDCLPTENHNAMWNCTERDGKVKDRESTMYIVRTDNKSWALVVRCFPNNGMNWAIFSRETQISDELAKPLVQKVVEEFGFLVQGLAELSPG